MKPREELLNNLQLEIKQNSYNKHLISELALRFNKKGFPLQRANQIFSDASPLESLPSMELILLTKELYSLTKNKDINPNDYFSNAELMELDNYKKPQNEQTDKLVLKNVVQIDDLQWVCPYWTLQEIYNAHNNAQLSYNFNTQREATYKKTQTGDIIITATLNRESVKDIAEEVYEEKFTPNLITLNVRLIDGKKPNIKYNKESMELIITPDYDFNSDNTTFIDILDGFHRINGVLNAVHKALVENKELKGGLIVSITCMTEEEARNYIAREAKRNDMSEEYKKALTNDDYSKVVSQFNNESKNNILKDKIADTKEELSHTDKYTTREVIREALKQTGIDIADAIEVKMSISKIIEIINMLVNLILRNVFNGDMNKLKDSVFLQSNIFLGYIAIANELKNDGDYMDKLMIIIDILNDKQNKEYVSLGIYSKQVQAKKIYEYFKNIVEEVKKNVS